jgi:hypothetical protein
LFFLFFFKQLTKWVSKDWKKITDHSRFIRKGITFFSSNLVLFWKIVFFLWVSHFELVYGRLIIVVVNVNSNLSVLK